MIHPTIYENIRVVLEGEVYDLDLVGKIKVIHREDLVDLASLSRKYRIEFVLNDGQKNKSAIIELVATAEDLSKEILELEEVSQLGCNIVIYLSTPIGNIEKECQEYEKKLNELWKNRPSIEQKITSIFSTEQSALHQPKNQISLHFGRKINEDNIGDLEHLVEYTYLSLLQL